MLEHFCIPPALPLPPTGTCILMTNGKPISCACALASSSVREAMLRGAGIPYSENRAFAWNSKSLTARGPARSILAVG